MGVGVNKHVAVPPRQKGQHHSDDFCDIVRKRRVKEPSRTSSTVRGGPSGARNTRVKAIVKSRSIRPQFDRREGSGGNIIMLRQNMHWVRAELGRVIVQLVNSPRSDQLTQSQEGMRTREKSSTPQSITHVGPNTYMMARHMVGRPVTTNPPT